MLISNRLSPAYNVGKAFTFHQILPVLLYLWRWWPFPGRLVPERVLESDFLERLIECLQNGSLLAVSKILKDVKMVESNSQ